MESSSPSFPHAAVPSSGPGTFCFNREHCTSQVYGGGRKEAANHFLILQCQVLGPGHSVLIGNIVQVKYIEEGGK